MPARSRPARRRSTATRRRPARSRGLSLRPQALALAAAMVVSLAGLAAASPNGGVSLPDPTALVRSRDTAPTPTPRLVHLGAAEYRFVEQVGEAARRLRAEVGLPPSLVVSMAINESGWGRSSLSRQAHNYFGIKAVVGTGTAGSVVEETQEVVNGRTITIRAPFRAYRSLEDSIRDLGAFLRDNPRYEGVWNVADDPRAAARAIAAAGYATDPAWADKLIRLIDEYGLEALDRP